MTAVEWLVEEINKINVSTEARLFINKLKEKAKQMEKEQNEISDEEIEKFAKSINPYPSTKQGSVDWENGFIRAIQWYREQFKKK